MSRASDETGFSLLEMLVVGTVMLAVIGAALSLTYQTQANSSHRADEMATRQMARLAMGKMVSEARLTGFRAGAEEPLQAAEPGRVQFVADVDDGNPEEPCSVETFVAPLPERITYEVRDDGSLYRGVQCRSAKNDKWEGDPVWTVVAAGIDTATTRLRYVDAGGNELGDGTGPLSATERQEVRSLIVELELVVADGDPLVGPDANALFQGTNRIRLHNLEIDDR